jgi:hypothetical protein
MSEEELDGDHAPIARQIDPFPKFFLVDLFFFFFVVSSYRLNDVDFA